MSRTRLIASLSAVACTLCLAAVAVVWAFPLKASARAPQAVAESGAAQPGANQLVMEIKVTAKAKDGSALGGLTTDDFLVFEDGAQQKIEFVIPNEFSTGPGYFIGFLSPEERESAFRHIDLRLVPKWGINGQDYTLASGEAHYSKLTGGIAGGISHGISGGIANGISAGISDGISQGISNSVSQGVSQGISAGVPGARRIAQNADSGVPVVNRDALWPFTAKRGDLALRVRGLGTIVAVEEPGKFAARIVLPDANATDVELGQSAEVDTHEGIVEGRVSHIKPTSDGLTVVDIALDSKLQAKVSTGDSVDGAINIGSLQNVLYIGRPVHAPANSEVSLFKIVGNGSEAERVNVRFGRASVNEIQVLSGLKEGDTVILSDMSAYDNFNRIQIKQ